MSPAVRVMQIIDGLNFGGAEVLLRDLTRGLLARGYKVTARYSTPGPIAEEIGHMGVPVKRLPRLGRVDPFLLLRMWREIRRERPDVVHTHLFKSDFHGRLAARLAGVPVIVSTLHNCHNWARNPVLGRTYGLTARFADEIIAVSDEVRDHAVRYAHLDEKKVTTIPNAIPVERFEDARTLGPGIRKELGIPMEATVLGIVARLTEQKDHANFLRAAAIIAEAAPGTRFLVAGEGPLRASLADLAASLELAEVVTFTGARKDIPAIYGAMDVLVFSSRWEGLPVALLEGMASGLPVIATRVGGIPEVLEHGVGGIIVPPSDPAALAVACLKLIRNPVLGQQMGAAGLAHVKAHYSIDAMVEATSRLYQSLLRKAKVA
ncbi:MAG: glycosyltransferase [Chloroflexota bacterium]